MILMIQGPGSVRYSCVFGSGMPVSSMIGFKAVHSQACASRVAGNGSRKAFAGGGGLLSKVVGLREEPTWLSNVIHRCSLQVAKLTIVFFFEGALKGLSDLLIDIYRTPMKNQEKGTALPEGVGPCSSLSLVVTISGVDPRNPNCGEREGERERERERALYIHISHMYTGICICRCIFPYDIMVLYWSGEVLFEEGITCRIRRWHLQCSIAGPRYGCSPPALVGLHGRVLKVRVLLPWGSKTIKTYLYWAPKSK